VKEPLADVVVKFQHFAVERHEERVQPALART
jgi:hypothetical protein